MDMLMNFVYQYGDVVQFFVWVFHYATLAIVAIVAVIWWVRVAKMKTSGACCGHHGHGGHHAGHPHHAGHHGHAGHPHHGGCCSTQDGETASSDSSGAEPVDVKKFVD